MNRRFYHSTLFAVMMLYTIAGVLAAPAIALAQVHVTATVDQNRVGIGEQIALTLTVSSASAHVPSVMPPTLPAIPNVTTGEPQGPSTSQNISIINGQMSRKVTLSYVYVLVPQKAGEFTIPSLAVTIDGRQQETQPIHVSVFKSGQNGTPTIPIRLHLHVSHDIVWQGQEVIVEYTLWERNTGSEQVTNREITKEPDFTGYWVEPLLDARKDQVTQETKVVDGVSYSVLPLMRVALFPTGSGTLPIPSLSLAATIAVPTANRNFWGQQIYQQRTITIESPPRSIEVKSLPDDAPPGFSGAVGTFHLTGSVDRTHVTQGDPVTWTLTLEGEGNIKAISNLDIPSLSEFRAYDPNITTTLDKSTEHFAGVKTWQRVLIPLHSGEEAVPPASFVFFDPNSRQYRTISSDRYMLAVAPSTVQEGQPAMLSMTQQEIKQVGSDIQFIEPDAVQLHDDSRTIWDSKWFWAAHAVPFTLLLIAFGVRIRTNMRSDDPAHLRASGARSEARKRLKAAEKLRKKGDLIPMIGAVEDAVAEYVASQANVSAAGLTSDRIQEILTGRGTASDTIDATLALLDRCDRARFAPSRFNQEEANNLYQASYELIDALSRRTDS